MSEPIVADNKPVKKSLTRGEAYFFCACGHEALSKFNHDDLATWKRDMADLSGVRYAGFTQC